MKTRLLIPLLLLQFSLLQAEDGRRPMLEQGKTWYYIYNHFEDKDDAPGSYDHTTWMVAYYLRGDTVINDTNYMKMYRMEYDDRQTKSDSYFAAYREDEEGKVYVLYKEEGAKELLLLDLSLKFEEEDFGFKLAEPVKDTIKVDGSNGIYGYKDFCRYRYRNTRPDGSKYMLGYIAVEGVGFEGYGLVHYLFEPQYACVCDFEAFAYVRSNTFFFTNANFRDPRWIGLSQEERTLVESNNNFALNLFRTARKEENLLLSPLSITQALGMVNNGAAGQTQEEINQVLGFGEAGADAINGFNHKMLSECDVPFSQTKVSMANTIFVNSGDGYELQPLFVEKAKTFYDAEPESRDFKDGMTKDVINQWASDHTEEMIKEVLTDDTFRPDAVSYLLNALYFKGQWKIPFKEKNTAEESFNGGDKMPIMSMKYEEFEYMDNDTYQALKLPYGNGAYLMTVLLPREGKTIGDVLEVLDGKNWQFQSRMHETDLKLPRFETDVNIDLVDIMKELGMPLAFDERKAEFPYFCNSGAFIGQMTQVAKIRVDEQGTEAAAVTVIDMAPTGITPRATFHATRPFLYLISEQSTGAIFFIGQFMGNTAARVKGISRNEKTETTDALYDLSGRRVSVSSVPSVSSVLPKGVYIQNGKKFVIK